MVELEITRLAPGDGAVEVEWRAAGAPLPDVRYVLEYKARGALWRAAARVPLAGHGGRATLRGLANGRDYELRLAARRSESGDLVTESATRLVRPGLVPGTVVNYIHPEDYTYNESGRSTASPSLVELNGGVLLASHDVYWGGHGQNLSMVFRSEDRGRTWSFVSEIRPCFWGKLFRHRGALYMLATTTEYGALVIRRSTDEGRTWSAPAEILPAGSRERGGPHKAPVPVVEHRGRLWTAVEHGSWTLGAHDAGIVSVPVDADLLDPECWTATPFLKYDPNWPGTVRPLPGKRPPSVLEGNVVVTPDGGLVNILRYHTRDADPPYGKAVVLAVDAERPGAPLTFLRVIDFHGNMSKFTIQYDPVTRRYWSLVNRVTSPVVSQRNILTLVWSADLIRWEIAADILNYEENGWPEDLNKVGFQYVDWLFDGEDIIFLSRTAINGAWNYHNANHITFHRIEGFRRYLDR